MTSGFTGKNASNKLTHPYAMILMLLLLSGAGFIISKAGLMAAGAFITLPVLFIFLIWIFLDPRNGVIAYLIAAFLIGAAGKYITGVPFGLSMDGVLTITLIAFIFRNFYTYGAWKAANHPLVWVSLAWFIFIFLEFFNPEAASEKAWFYAMRGIALYPLLTFLMVILVFNKPKDLRLFMKIWAVFTILSALKGLQQKYIGIDPFEQQWLDEGASSTHILFGNLRAFGLYSDAGSFGAAMGHALIVFGAAGIDTKTPKSKVLFFVASGLGFIGLIISGTRGALVVPGLGILLYLLLKKNIKLFILGVIALVGVFMFLKFTTIGNNVYEINRMRTVLDPQDASLQARLQNQEKIADYIKDKPFGAGIGSIGSFARRFTPHTYLAQIPPDSWYVRIYAETGIVGLILHFIMLFYFLIAGSKIVLKKIHNREINGIFAGIMGGYFGIMAASYGNQVLGQMPIGQTLYIGLALVFLGPKIQNELNQKSNQ